MKSIACIYWIYNNFMFFAPSIVIQLSNINQQTASIRFLMSFTCFKPHRFIISKIVCTHSYCMACFSCINEWKTYHCLPDDEPMRFKTRRCQKSNWSINLKNVNFVGLCCIITVIYKMVDHRCCTTVLYVKILKNLWIKSSIYYNYVYSWL